MMASIQNLHGELGQLFISERALEMIVYGALLEVDGLYAPDRVRGGSLLDTISKTYQGAGIQILKVSGESPKPARGKGEQREAPRLMKVKLSLFARFGIDIHTASEQAIQKVRLKVKELAGLDIDDIEVEITGIVTA